MADIDWRGCAGMRNILVHEYFGIDPEILWNVITVRVPKLVASIGKALASPDL